MRLIACLVRCHAVLGCAALSITQACAAALCSGLLCSAPFRSALHLPHRPEQTLAPPTPQVPCPESFSDAYCAIASEAPALTEACTAKPWCTTVNALLAASMGVRMVQGPVGSLIGVLKQVTETVQPHQLCYTPFSALYMQRGKVALPPLPPQPAAVAPPPPAAAPPPGAAASPLPDESGMFWSILRRPQGELRQVGNGEPLCVCIFVALSVCG